jgi:glycosyltransferase involved in cell wall biosynthesis
VPVSLVITDLDVGGAERALVALATGLDRARWNPQVICLGPEGALEKPLRDAGLRVVTLNARSGRPLQAVVRLAKALRSHRPELVQSFLFHANVVSRLAALLARRPWVVGGLRVAEHEKTWHRWLDRLTIPLALGSVCVSKGVERFAIEIGRLRPERLVVIPNGIDPAPFDAATPVDRASLQVPADAHLALFVGRMTLQKGVPVLLDAARIVARQHPNWYLALVGDGPELAPLRETADGDTVLRDRLRWLGRRTDVPGLLRTCNLLVLPSLWEGMPNVVLEAMAARRAVVATAVEGTEDLVLRDQTGWLVPRGDSARLAEALHEAAGEPDTCHALGLAGRERVETCFSPAAVVAAYDRLWSEILGYDDGTAPSSNDRA